MKKISKKREKKILQAVDAACKKCKEHAEKSMCEACYASYLKVVAELFWIRDQVTEDMNCPVWNNCLATLNSIEEAADLAYKSP